MNDVGVVRHIAPVSEGVDTLDVHGYVKDAQVLSNIGLRQSLAIGIFVIFASTVAATYVLIFLWGFEKIKLPSAFAHWLGGATVGQTAGMLLLVLKDLFPGAKSVDSVVAPNRRRKPVRTDIKRT